MSAGEQVVEMAKEETDEERILNAVVNGSLAENEDLLWRMGNVNQLYDNHGTLLHMAVNAGAMGSVKDLLEKGADPYVKNGKGITALRLADELRASRPDEEDRKKILELLTFVVTRSMFLEAASRDAEVEMNDSSLHTNDKHPLSDENTPVEGALKKLSSEVKSLQDSLIVHMDRDSKTRKAMTVRVRDGFKRQNNYISRDVRCGFEIQEEELDLLSHVDKIEKHLSREGSSQKEAVAECVAREMSKLKEELSERFRLQMERRKDAVLEHVDRQVVMKVNQTSERLSREMSTLKEELVAALGKTVGSVREALVSRDALLEKLKVSMTSLAKESVPMNRFAMGMRSRVEEMGGGVGGNLCVGSVPLMLACDEESERKHCIDSMLAQTELWRRSADDVNHVRSMYEKIYSTSPLTAGLLRYLQGRQEVQVYIDCTSRHIGNIKDRLKDQAGREWDGRHCYTFADLKASVVYAGGKADSEWTMESCASCLVLSLAQVAISLAFGNGGRPYAVGDEVAEEACKVAIQEAHESWLLEDCTFDRLVNEYMTSSSGKEREVCCISVVPAFLVFYGLPDGLLKARRRMRLLTKLYEEQVILTLSKEMDNTMDRTRAVAATVAGLVEQFEADAIYFLNICRTLLQVMQTIQAEEEAARMPKYAILNQEQEIIRALLSDNWEMRKHIQVSRPSFNSLLTLISSPKRSGWDMKWELVIFLYWLECGASYHVLSSVFHIPRSTVSDMVNKMLLKVVSLQRRVISLPSAEEIEEIGRGFGRLSGTDVFNIVAGAIDGSHIEVIVRGQNHADYFNRKLRYSIQFQGICDHKGKFIHVFAGYPGSVHDARVLRASPLMAGIYPPQGYALLGDSGYPCLREPIAILTPYREPVEGPDQARYNAHHRRGRNIIERAFGMLKTRWRCIFLQRVNLKHTKVANIIGACCIMHNICITNGEILQGDAQVNELHVLAPENPGNGFDFRNEMAYRMAMPVDLPDQLLDHDYL